MLKTNNVLRVLTSLSTWRLLVIFASGVVAMGKPVLSLLKKSQGPQEATFLGSPSQTPGYEYAELTFNSPLSEAITLEYNIAEDQCFTPVVRDATGEVVSTGSPFGFLRAPSLEFKAITIAPRGTRTFEFRIPLETVPDEKRKPSTYHFRVQFRHNGRTWESNEIEITYK